MRSDEELIAERNTQAIAQALLDTMNVFCKFEGCENRYIRDIGKSLIDKYCEILLFPFEPIEQRKSDV